MHEKGYVFRPSLQNCRLTSIPIRSLSGQQAYVPTVTVATKKLNDKIEIKVEDNGNGIPQNIVDKIFQPFFTTKPTGQGTGWGLSLAYDTVKAHGGEIKWKQKVMKEMSSLLFYLHIKIDLCKFCL